MKVVGGHQARVQQWRTAVTNYLPKAFARTHFPHHPRPMDVKHLFSAGFIKGGPRFWAFDSVELRDRFVKYIHSAEACEDPHP